MSELAYTAGIAKTGTVIILDTGEVIIAGFGFEGIPEGSSAAIVGMEWAVKALLKDIEMEKGKL